jgi:vacuolar-type H+-ATPase subunit I/STV1
VLIAVWFSSFRVEFQSKFYKGEGVKFHAFHFKRVTDDVKDD